MREVRFTERAVSEIKKFIRSYEEGFFNLYKDSGIWSEDIIIRHFKEAATRLSDKIFLEIEQHLYHNKILGRKQSTKWLELSFYIGDRLIVIYFSEDNNEQTRWIEAVYIDRKPILF